MIMAGYAQVTLVGVDLDHVTTSRHDPQAAHFFCTGGAPMAALSLSGLWLLPRTTSQVALRISAV
jgi:hypothetical protein